MKFDWTTDECTSHSILDHAVEEGVNLADAADVYGGPQRPDLEAGYGISEEVIGRWLARDASRRDRVVLATKLYQPMGTGPNDKYLSTYKIRCAPEASLRRLQTDHIAFYQMHHVDRGTPWDEIWQAMQNSFAKARSAISAAVITPAGRLPQDSWRSVAGTSSGGRLNRACRT